MTREPSGRMPKPSPNTSPGGRRSSAAVAVALVAVVMLAAAVQAPGEVAQASTSQPATSPAVAAQIITLIPALTGEADPATRKQAALQILATGSDAGIQALLDILELRNNTAAKLAICEALSETKFDNPVFVDRLLALLDDNNSALVKAAMDALAWSADPGLAGQGALASRVRKRQEEMLTEVLVARSKELYALLGTEGDRTARLLSWLRSPLSVDRLIALEIIHGAMVASTPTPPVGEVLQQVRQMVSDADEAVRRQVVVVLRDLQQQKEDNRRLLNMLAGETSPVVLAEIYRALGRLGEPESIPACLEGLAHPDPNVAACAADALGRLCLRGGNGDRPPGTAEVVTALMDRLAAGGLAPVLRQEIVDSMGEIADPAFLPYLIESVEAVQPAAIRQTAVRALGRIGDPNQIPLVLRMLSGDPDPGVREAAAEALGRLGSGQEVLAALRSRLDNKTEPAPAVQTRAWDAYRAVFGRLSADQQLQIIETWNSGDPASASRRLDLLVDAEKSLGTANTDPGRTVAIREMLGDAYLATGRHALAATVLARAQELIPPEQTDERLRVARKLVQAHLAGTAPERAITAAGAAIQPMVREALAGQLEEYLVQLARSSPAQAADFFSRLQRTLPADYVPDWPQRLTRMQNAVAKAATTAGSTIPAG